MADPSNGVLENARITFPDGEYASRCSSMVSGYKAKRGFKDRGIAFSTARSRADDKVVYLVVQHDPDKQES